MSYFSMRAVILLLSLSGSFQIANAVGFYVQPCLKQEQTKEKALKILNLCLDKTGRPPFKEKEGGQSKVVCTNEMENFEAAVKDYRICFKETDAYSLPNNTN